MEDTMTMTQKIGRFELWPVTRPIKGTVAAVAIKDTRYGKEEFDTELALLMKDGQVRWEAFDNTGEGLSCGTSKTDFYPKEVKDAARKMLRAMAPKDFKPKEMPKRYLKQIPSLLEDACAENRHRAFLGITEVPPGKWLQINLDAMILSDMSLSPSKSIHLSLLPANEVYRRIDALTSKPGYGVKAVFGKSQTLISNIRRCEDDQNVTVIMLFDSMEGNKVLQDLIMGKKVRGILRI